jgi:hypothetical protein
MNHLPPTGSTVVTTVELHHANKSIPVHTVGRVVSYRPPTLIKIDFGPYGIVYVTQERIEAVHWGVPNSLLGCTLLDLTEDLIGRVVELNEDLNAAIATAPIMYFN